MSLPSTMEMKLVSARMIRANARASGVQYAGISFARSKSEHGVNGDAKSKRLALAARQGVHAARSVLHSRRQKGHSPVISARSSPASDSGPASIVMSCEVVRLFVVDQAGGGEFVFAGRDR